MIFATTQRENKLICFLSEDDIAVLRTGRSSSANLSFGTTLTDCVYRIKRERPVFRPAFPLSWQKDAGYGFISRGGQPQPIPTRQGSLWSRAADLTSTVTAVIHALLQQFLYFLPLPHTHRPLRPLGGPTGDLTGWALPFGPGCLTAKLGMISSLPIAAAEAFDFSHFSDRVDAFILPHGRGGAMQ